jgi:hypothetical protein
VNQRFDADLDVVVRRQSGRDLGRLRRVEVPGDPVREVVRDGFRGGVVVATHLAATRYETDDVDGIEQEVWGDSVGGRTACIRPTPMATKWQRRF